MSHQSPQSQHPQSSQLTNVQQPQQGTAAQQQTGGAVQTQQPAPTQQGATGKLFTTRNYLSSDVRRNSIAALNQCLADLTAVNMQCKTAHWNVRGPDFYQLHELFEDVVAEFDELIDMVAERATALGGQAQGTPPAIAQQANVPQLSPATSDERQLLEQVAASLATLDATLYEQINRVSEQGDLDTADLFNEISREVSKSLWFVEAHLQGPQVGAGSAQIGQQAQSANAQ